MLETIRLQDGALPLLSYHQQRLQAAQRYFFGANTSLELASEIIIPEDKTTGRFKLRVLYREQIERVEIEAYTIRPVQALQLLEINELDYTFKYADRSGLNQLFGGRSYGDDVLLVRHGYLTDTSYANVALFDGTNWYTPARPLLPGTARARLLAEKALIPTDIHYKDLGNFTQLRLINAMMDWHEGPLIPVENIRW